MERDIHDYYDANYPGRVQVLGVDLYNGTPAQLQSFQNSTGAEYPLLLQGWTAPGGNVVDLYVFNETAPWDNYIVINKKGIVRYHSALTWPHGNRYHLNEIRGSIDSLVTSVVGVDDRPASEEITLSVAPNPAPGRIGVRLALPAAGMDRVRVQVLDLLGRRVSTLWNGRAAGGSLDLQWDGRGEQGPVPPGLYRVIADLDGRLLERRLAIVR